jgi:hypothetical protein
MWAKISGWFSASEPPGQLPGSPGVTFGGASDELTAIRTELVTVRLQLSSASHKVASLASQQDDLYLQRENLLLECHDAYLHPQLNGEAPPTLEVMLSTARPPHDVPAEQWLTETQEAGFLPFHLTNAAHAQPDHIGRVFAALQEKVSTLTSTFASVLLSLQQKREKLDDGIFNLELRMTQLETAEMRLKQRLFDMDPGSLDADETRRRNEARRQQLESDEPPQVVVLDPRSPPTHTCSPSQAFDTDERT